MGAYMYKVTGKKVRDDQGRLCNLLKFAYKPYGWSGDNANNNKLNNKLFYATGCYNADRYVENSKRYTQRITMEEGRPSIPWPRESGGSLTDYMFDWRLTEDLERV